MPWRIQIKAIGGLLKGRGPKAIVQPAVGDPNEMGFSAFYAAVLSHVSQTPYAFHLPPVPFKCCSLPVCSFCECNLIIVQSLLTAAHTLLITSLTRPLSSARSLACLLCLRKMHILAVTCLQANLLAAIQLSSRPKRNKPQVERVSCYIRSCSRLLSRPCCMFIGSMLASNTRLVGLRLSNGCRANQGSLLPSEF